MVDQTSFEPKKTFYCQYKLEDGEHAAYLDGDRMEWDDEKGYLRVYKDDALVGVYDLSVLLIAHIREKIK